MVSTVQETASDQGEREEREERLARARAALGTAERRAARWGGRIDRTALRSLPGPGIDDASTAEEHPRQPRESDDGSGSRLPVPAPLAELFPRASLRAGSSVAVDGAASTSLLLALAVVAAGEDSWCAIAGMPDLGLRSALDAGLDPCRLAIAPTTGEQAPQVLSALADGVGVLVLGPHPGLLSPALWRSLLGRARSADTLVLAAAPPGRADLTLTASSRGWVGLGIGSGRLRRRRVTVTSSGRGIAGHRETDVLLPQVQGLLDTVPDLRSEQTGQGADRRIEAVPTGSRVDAVPSGTRLTLHTARRAG